jgi:hypothetical protein
MGIGDSGSVECHAVPIGDSGLVACHAVPIGKYLPQFWRILAPSSLPLYTHQSTRCDILQNVDFQQQLCENFKLRMQSQSDVC